jgi:protein involved in polysaccharide export with SLBB domain
MPEERRRSCIFYSPTRDIDNECGAREQTIVSAGLRIVLMIFIGSIVSACSPTSSMLGVAGAPTPPIVGDSSQVKLENGDKLKVAVYNEPQLSGEYVVDTGGAITFPLVGQVVVAGMDARGAEEALRKRLSGRFLVNPKLSVEIISQRPFYMMGEVGKPGEFPYRPGLNVVAAIALAGGFTPRASQGAVTIRRAANGQIVDVPVDPSVAIFPGDMVTVAERLF